MVRTTLPINIGLLEILLFEIDRHYLGRNNQPYLAILYKAIFSTAYYGLMRIGELTMGSHPVKGKDVCIARSKNKITLVLYPSKTHGKESKVQEIKISALSNYDCLRAKRHFCPFELLRQYGRFHGGYAYDDDLFFIFRDGTPVTPVHVRSLLHKLLEILNLDSSMYNTHSWRIGRASDLFQINKFSISQIQQAGRWHSNVVFKYLKNI